MLSRTDTSEAKRMSLRSLADIAVSETINTFCVTVGYNIIPNVSLEFVYK